MLLEACRRVQDFILVREHVFSLQHKCVADNQNALITSEQLKTILKALLNDVFGTSAAVWFAG